MRNVKTIFSSRPYQQPVVLALVRFMVGIFMIYHGVEIFDTNKMTEYGKWMIDLDFVFPSIAAYFGKGFELLSGILLAVGFLTRVASMLLVMTMSIVTFGIGNGHVFMEDQHPFLFVLFGFMFLFLGAGDFSVDKKIFHNNA